MQQTKILRVSCLRCTAIITLLTLIFFSVIGSNAQPQVWYVSGNGSDSNTGLSVNSPFRTLQKAADLTDPGDVVYVMNGIYNQTQSIYRNNKTVLCVTRSGSPNGYITYRNYPGHSPKISGADATWNCVLILANYIKFEGFEVEGTNQSSSLEAGLAAHDYYETNGASSDFNYIGTFNCNGIYIGEAKATVIPHHVEIRNCKVHDFSNGGIGTWRVDYITIDDNIVYNNAWYGMYASSGISLFHTTDIDSNFGIFKCFIRNNICYNNKTLVPWADQNKYSDGNGIIIDDNLNSQITNAPLYKSKTLVENNVCFNNGGSGINCFSNRHVLIRNNTTYNNATVLKNYAEIGITWSRDCQAVNNVIFGQPGGKLNSYNLDTAVIYDYNIYSLGGVTDYIGTNDTYADAVFVNRSIDPNVANFRLQSNSPGVDDGTTAYGVGSVDADGYLRVVGTIDRGAFERRSSLGTPYSGSAIAIPGTLEVENFDNGGEGTGYHDLDASNQGGSYRTSGVDIYTGDGNFKIGSTAAGEWLDYTVDIAKAGSYNVTARVASNSSLPGAFRIEVNGRDLTGAITVNNTGGYNAFANISFPINFSEGIKVLRLFILNGAFDISSLTFSYAQTSYQNSATVIPGVLEVENYDQGGTGIAYSDATPGNSGSQYRTDDVDIYTGDGNYKVGSIASGEWLEYTCYVVSPGTYTLAATYSSIASGGSFRIDIDGYNYTGTIPIGNTGSYNVFNTVYWNVNLKGGQQVLRIVPISGGFDLGKITFTKANLFDNPGFEQPTTSPWSANGATLARSSSQASSGSWSGYSSSRTASWQGPLYNIKNALIANDKGIYALSARLRTASGTATGQLTVKINHLRGTVEYFSLPTATINSSAWTTISGNMNITWGDSLSTAEFYVQTPGSTVSFYVDDFSLVKGTSEVQTKAMRLGIEQGYDVSTEPIETSGIFPNPVVDYFTLENADNLPKHLTIKDSHGRNLLNASIVDQDDRIYVGNLPAGLYFVTVKGKNKTAIMKMIRK